MTETASQIGLIRGGHGRRGCRAWLTDSVPSRACTLPLLLLTFLNALLDTASYGSLHVYSTCQTGNFITASILLTGNGPNGDAVPARISAVCASLGAFWVGGFLYGQAAQRVGSRARWWLLFSILSQTALVGLCAALSAGDVVHTWEGLSWVLVLLLSLAGGGQVALAKGCGIPEISTAILTSPFIDTLGNPDLFIFSSLPGPRARKRILQWAYLATFFAGAFLGGGLYRRFGTQPVFWVGVVLRVAVGAWFALLKGEDEKPAAGA